MVGGQAGAPQRQWDCLACEETAVTHTELSVPPTSQSLSNPRAFGWDEHSFLSFIDSFMAFEACARDISSKGPFPGTCPGLSPILSTLIYYLCATCPILKLPDGLRGSLLMAGPCLAVSWSQLSPAWV